jgi:hypothetical protein
MADKHALYMETKGQKGSWSGHITSLDYRQDDDVVYDIADFKKASWSIREDPLLMMNSIFIEVMSADKDEDDEDEDFLPIVRYSVTINKTIYQTSNSMGLVGFLYTIKKPDSYGQMVEIPYLEPIPVRVTLHTKGK